MQTTSPLAAVPLAIATAVAWTSCESRRRAEGSNDRPYSFLIVSETGVRDPSAKHSGVRRDSYDRTPAYHLHLYLLLLLQQLRIVMVFLPSFIT